MRKTKALSSRTWHQHTLAFVALLVVAVASAREARAEVSGFLEREGRTLFPIGCYELPKEDQALREMADAGINLIRCRGKADLDRAAAVGIQGWIPLPLQLGENDKLRERILEVKDHPALAVWEGPDEIVHTFTKYSGLYRKAKIHKTANAWNTQSPEAVEYAKKKAAKILPGLRAGARLVRELDQQKRPIWINEASNSDLKYVRGYLDSVDITGCDTYPVSATNRNLTGVAKATERWKEVGRGQKPVWMVLQAFSWHELGDYYGAKKPAYPAFDQSRQMAYLAVVHGAKGILYWGSHYLKSDDFRQSLYALTRELATLQPFLVAPEVENVRVALVEIHKKANDRGVRATVRKVDDQWLVVLVNEDDRAHLAVEVSGLAALDGRRLVLLYGAEETQIEHGELLTRMLPNQVKVFATDRRWETDRREGRNFGRP